MNDLVEKIKSQLDIITALEIYTSANLKPLRNRKKGHIICPFHSEQDGSFFVDTTKNSWHCYGACGVGGDVINLYAVARGIDNKSAILMLGAELGLIDSNTEVKIDPKINAQIRKNKLLKEIEEGFEIVYVILSDILYLLKLYVSLTENISQLELISAMVHDIPYIEYILDCLLEHYGKTNYLQSFIIGKEMIKKWGDLLSKI